MRRPERIPIFLDLTYGKVSDILFLVFNLSTYLDPVEIVNKYYNKLSEIKSFWLDNPDLRFSQVLIAKEIIPNTPGSWYYREDSEILEELGFEDREFLLWGQNYDKDMNLLPKTIYRPIKDLNTDHIEAILNGNWCRYERHLNCFKKELKLRNDNT